MKLKTIFSLLIFTLFVNHLSYSQSWKPEPVATFNTLVSPKFPCSSFVNFNDSSKINNPCNMSGDSCDSIIEWIWDFGNGDKSMLKNPSHNYTQNGDFSISLSIKTKYGFTDTFKYLIHIEGPMPEFKVLSDTIIEVGDSVTFINTSRSPIYKPTWVWDFGDGSTFSSIQRDKVGHIYSKPGKYVVYLTEFDDIQGEPTRRCSAIYPDTARAVKKQITITVNKSSKVVDNSKTKLSIIPNPANDHIFIKGINNGEIVIYDLLGKYIFSKSFRNNEPLDISKLNTGVYFIKCIEGTMIYNTRFVKVD